MRMSKYYMPTLREDPSEAELPSHKLLLRAGMIRQLVSGVYTFLPLGYKVFRKIENIVREEMDASGAQEVLLSAVQPKEIWEQSKRWYDFGPEMFKLKDRHDRDFCLGPTHEEYFTSLINHELNSYKQLPLNLYQIQTKYRDEKRPRFGLIRAREFVMKDAYSFDIDEEGLDIAYKKMWDAYEKVFERCCLDFKVVEGDSGNMGGSGSHEFMAISDYGEGTIIYCKKCDYAATDEKAACIYDLDQIEKEEKKEIEKVHTPDIKTIQQLTSFFNIKSSNFVKSLIYEINDQYIVVLVPGDRDLNETKLFNFLNMPGFELEMADEEAVIRITGAAVGFAGPIGLKEKIRIIADKRVTKMKNFIIGANETDYHLKNVNFTDIIKQVEIAEDLISAQRGDICPKCSAELHEEKGIEVGNIFKLGKKYSLAANATFLDENGKEQHFVMGSYGIGVSRTVAAVVEQNYDDEGIIWPIPVAPYHVIITVVNTKKEDQLKLGQRIYNDLKSKGIEVILDDRNERAGVKFKDAELIGIPIRITVGKMASDNIVEFVLRKTKEKIEIKSEEIYRKILEEFNKYSKFQYLTK